MAPKNRKPYLFVGSSSESLRYAYSVQENLEPHDALVKVWSQGVFDLTSYALESLLAAAQSHDFAVFIFAADDVVIKRKQRHKAVRDNVIFEVGLFMGCLGRERTFVIAPRGVDLDLPTDLLGWNIAYYDPDRPDVTAALGVACNKVRAGIQGLGRIHLEKGAKFNQKPGGPRRRAKKMQRRIQSLIGPLEGPAPFAKVKTGSLRLAARSSRRPSK